MASSLVIKVTCGADDRERANQGLNVAATAVASGIPVSLWLSGEGSWLAVPGRGFELPHAVPTDELVATVLSGGTLTVCSQCAVRRDLTAADLVDGARIAGVATFLEESMRDGAQALVY